MRKTSDDILIAPERTSAQWRELRATLEPDYLAGPWEEAVDNFLMARLRSRYIRPIEAMKAGLGSHGEDFAIVSLQCALIEFLAALAAGKALRIS